MYETDNCPIAGRKKVLSTNVKLAVEEAKKKIVTKATLADCRLD